jgi:hypothetical protein
VKAVTDLGGSVAPAPRSKTRTMQSAPAPHNTAVHMPAMQYIIARSVRDDNAEL